MICIKSRHYHNIVTSKFVISIYLCVTCTHAHMCVFVHILHKEIAFTNDDNTTILQDGNMKIHVYVYI